MFITCMIMAKTLLKVTKKGSTHTHIWISIIIRDIQDSIYLLQNITIQENSPGKDGAEYMLNCYVKCNSIPKNVNIPPLTVPFLFYNGEFSLLLHMSQVMKKPVLAICKQ